MTGLTLELSDGYQVLETFRTAVKIGGGGKFMGLIPKV